MEGHLLPPHPQPAVKTRSPLSNIGDHIFKAARRLSMATTVKDNKDKDKNKDGYIPPPSPSFFRSGAASPDLKKKRNSTTIDDSREKRSKEITKLKEIKTPLIKMDLFNLKSRNTNASQMNLAATQQQLMVDQALLGSQSPPPLPSKETFWRGMTRQNQRVCTEDNYERPSSPQQNRQVIINNKESGQSTTLLPSPPSPSSPQQPRVPRCSSQRPQKGLQDGAAPVAAAVSVATAVSARGSDGHTDIHQHDRYSNVEKHPQPQSQQKQTQPLVQQTIQEQATKPSISKSAQDQAFVPIPLQQSSRVATSTMSDDLALLSISSLQGSMSSISDQSLQMEDVYDVYDSYSIESSYDTTGSRQSSVRDDTERRFSDQGLMSTTTPETQTAELQHQTQPYSQCQSSEGDKSRNALERIQQQMVGITAPSEKNNTSTDAGKLSSTPSQALQQQPQQTPSEKPTAPGLPTESTMLDHLMTLVPGPNRPRLPSQIEWQQGIEELYQKRKDAAALTSSLGRQNSTGSRHSRESSADGKSRRHSMPDMPHGQSQEDRDRQRGDNFRNPMLLSSPPGQKRRSVYEDREQMLLQPPIQRQSIAEAQAMDTSLIPTTTAVQQQQSRPTRKRAGRRDEPEEPGRGTASPVDRLRDVGKDAVDVAFDEMLTKFSLPATTRVHLESLPKDRKWAMLQSNDANPSLYQTPQTVPPQFFVDVLQEFSGKKKRSSRDQLIFNLVSTGVSSPAASGKQHLGMWKNLSTTNINNTSSNSIYNNNNNNNGMNGATSVDHLSSTYAPPQFQPTFQQHLTSILGKSEKRTLEEREQVLKKLRVLIRNGSIRWTGEFIKVGGPSALLQFCRHVQRTEETKLGQRERLLHQVIQCIKAIVHLEGGVDALVKESIFFSLMRTLAIHEAPVLGLGTGSKTKSGTSYGTQQQQKQQRTRSSSIPKPIHSNARLAGSHHPSSFMSSPALSADQIPTFSNAQSSVSVLVAILAREPELRDRILKEAVADPSPTMNQWKSGDDGAWRYTEWIAYLKAIIHVCGVSVECSSESQAGSTAGIDLSCKDMNYTEKFSNGSKIVSVGAGLASMGSGSPSSSSSSGSNLSMFSLENMRRRRHTAATGTSPSQGGYLTGHAPMNGIKYEPGEEREILAYLTAHLELISKLIFDMHISNPGLALAKSLKECHMEEYLERLRSAFIQYQDLSAQAEDIQIQLSMVPSTTLLAATRLSNDLPVIPPLDHPQDPHHALERHERLTSPTPPPHPQYQRMESLQYPPQRSPQFHDAKYDAQVVPKTTLTATEIPLRNSSLDSFANEQSQVSGYGINGIPNGGAVQRPMYGGARARSHSQFRSSPPNQASQQQQQQPQQIQGGNGGGVVRTRKAAVIGIAENLHSGKEGSNGTCPSAGSILTRQISVKRVSIDDHRRIGGENYRPAPIGQQTLARAQSTTATTAGRRATVGEPLPSSHSSSRLPAIPPKSKYRPNSMDGKVARGGELLLKPMEYTTVKLDSQHQHPSFRKQQLHQPVSDVRTTPASRPLSLGDIKDREEDVPRDVSINVGGHGSTNTFGHARRSSLNNAGNVMARDHSHANSLDSTSVAPTAESEPVSGFAHGHGQTDMRVGDSGTSSCSSTTSSGYSATTSASSVSPLSSQTRKHSMLSKTANFSTSDASAALPPHPSMASRLSNLPTKLERSAALSGTQRDQENGKGKEVHEFRDVDFDTRIQEDVRKLALSSSNHNISKTGNFKPGGIYAGMTEDAKLRVSTTDPNVLEAPIIVPEDMSMMREQYIRDQLSGIVLPPFKAKDMSVAVSSTPSPSRPVRRVSVGSGGPISASSATNIVSHGANASGIPRLYQLGSNARGSSLDVTTPSPSGGVNGGNGQKVNISERIKMFDRA
ncbi:hypothetical protein BG011_008505 [Mortierella polycephala]|uniref:Formin GTPase-binding domain-containing protein n=1 Tax=Mortierella polycephala TaxID=41804 RepID=A0A9P6TXJ4_9FUNG|nr:hypothetical protein BG011_008505 [Mortierella polycephala]